MADWNPSPRCSATHKLVIYMATFSTRISPFFPEFRHFLVSARGKLGLKGDLEGAERNFLTSLAWARRQQAKTWELRTAMSLARLWRSQGRRQDAYELL